jgi:hypothetical protein
MVAMDADAPTITPRDSIMTKLDKALRREIQVGDMIYTLTISPEGLKLVEKGHRNGVELRWIDLVNGDAALAASLQAATAKGA